MTKEDLIKRRNEVEARFNTINLQKNESEQEAYRLQGEYRLLGELIDEYETEKPKEAK